MKTKKQIISKRTRLITKYNKISNDKSLVEYGLVLGEIIALNWVLNKKEK